MSEAVGSAVREERSYYKKTSFSGTTGRHYEAKVASLLYLRGLRQDVTETQDGDDFYLATNVDGAGALEDIIFKYKPQNHAVPKTCFMVLNYRENKVITLKEIFDNKYYDSYLEIEKRTRNKKFLFDNELENCEYVFYTNADTERLPKDSEMKRDDQYESVIKEMLGSGGKTESIFRFTLESMKVTFSWIPDFLDRLTALTDQATGKLLGRLIDKELVKLSETKTLTKTVLFKKIEHWWLSSTEELTKTTSDTWKKADDKVVSTDSKIPNKDRERVNVCAYLFLRAMNSKEVFSIRRVDADSGVFGHIVYKYKLKGQEIQHNCYIDLRTEGLEEERLATELDFINIAMETAYKKTLKNFDSQKGTEVCEFAIYLSSSAEADTWQFQKCDIVPAAHVELFATNTEGDSVFLMDSAAIKDRVTNFYSRFNVFSKQAADDVLTNLIEVSTGKITALTKSPLVTLRERFVGRMRDWWARKRSVDALTKCSHLWWDVWLNAPIRDELRALKVSYIDEETDRFSKTLGDARATQLTTRDVKMTCLKLQETLERKRTERFMFVDAQILLKRKAEIRTALSGDWCEVIAVDCTEVDENSALVAEELRRVPQGKKIIVVSTAVQKLPQFAKDGYVVVEDAFDFYSLDDRSQKYLLARHVAFHGTAQDPITIEEVVNSEEVLRGRNEGTPSFDVKVFTTKFLRPYKENLDVGQSLTPDVPEYVSRTLSRSVNIKVEALRENRDDVFVVSNIDVEALRGKLGIEIDEEDEDYVEEEFVIDVYQKGCTKNGHVYVVNESEVTECITELNQTNFRVHWLQYNPNTNVFLWKRSTGNLGNIRKHIKANESKDFDTDTLLRQKEKVVLLTAEPGVGKTTQISHIALRIKESQPSALIVRVNLSEHPKLLASLGSEGCANEYEFLSSALTKEKGPSLERQLLCLRLRQHANVVVMLDGFDDIVGYHKEQALKILELMLKSKKPSQIWVTARRAMRRELEELMGTISYNLKDITQNEQKELLFKLWKDNNVPEERRNNLVTKIVDLLGKSFSAVHNNFLGIPLQIKMLAEVYDGSGGSENGLPSKINLLKLFEVYVDKKWEHYVATSGVKNDEDERDLFDEHHELGAMLALFNDKDVATLHDIELKKKGTRYFDKIIFQTGGTGIVDRMVDERPMFHHRSIAEYFASCWLASHFQYNREFLNRKMFQADFQQVRNLLDRKLARSLQLHEAVMNHDLEAARLFLTDVNYPDIGGRTPLHLAVLHMLPGDNWTNVVDNYRCQHLLLSARADMRARDLVLDMEAPAYAVRLGQEATASLLTAATNAKIPAYGELQWIENLSVDDVAHMSVDDQLDFGTAAYRLRLCGLLYLRSVNRKTPFCIGTNVAGAESFGDIVLRCKTKSVLKTFFIQVHRGEEKKFNLEDVKKYGEEHAAIMKAVAAEGPKSALFSPSDTCELIAFTTDKPEEVNALQSFKHDHNLTSKSEQSFRVVKEGASADFLAAFTLKVNEVNEADLDELLRTDLLKCNGVHEFNVRETLANFLLNLKKWWMWSDELLTEDSSLLGNSIPQQSKGDLISKTTAETASRKRSRLVDRDSLKCIKRSEFNSTVADHLYKVKMLSLIFIRNHPECYFLPPHIWAEGQLHDVVILRYKPYPNEPWHTCFIHFFNKQAVESPVVLKDFLKGGRFALGWYLKKYAKELLKSQQEVSENTENLLDDFKYWKFVAFTNCSGSKEMTAQPRGSSTDLIAQSLILGEPETLLTVKFTKESFPDLYLELMLMAMIPAVARGGDPSKWTDEFFQKFTLVMGQATMEQLDACMDASIASTLFTSPSDSASIRENYLLTIREGRPNPATTSTRF